jgi:hypothetical protein
VSETTPDLLEQAWLRDRNVADVVVTSRGGGIWRRLAWRVAFVLAGLAALDLALSAVLPPVELLPDTELEAAVYTVKVDRFATMPAPDVLFLGSSRVRDGMVPGIFEVELEREWGRPVRAYNLGLQNAMLEEYRALVASHLPDPPPPYVVLGLSGSELVMADDFRYAARFLWRWPDFTHWVSNVSWEGFRVANAENYIESVMARHWYLFGHRHELSERVLRTLGLESGPRAGPDVVTPGTEIIEGILSDDGFVRRHEWSKLSERLAYDPSSVVVWERDRLQPSEFVVGSRFEKLREVVAMLRARGCRVALVEVPASPYLQALNPVLQGAGLPASEGRAARPGFRTRMQELAAELDLPFVPCDAETSALGNDMFTDLNHLSVAGARRYSNRVVHELINAGFFVP